MALQDSLHAPDLYDSNPSWPLIIWSFEDIFITEYLLGLVLAAWVWQKTQNNNGLKKIGLYFYLV